MLQKFKVAFRGLLIACEHRAVLIQLLLGVLTVIAGFIVRLDCLEWCIFVLCIGLVIGFEIINTAIEKICDLIDENYNEKIKVIKDISAGSVLCISIMSLAICIIILFKRVIGG